MLFRSRCRFQRRVGRAGQGIVGAVQRRFVDAVGLSLIHILPCLPFGADCGPVHIGIDSGSTTIKLVVIDNDANILFESYRPNLGNPIPLVKETLLKLYQEHPGLQLSLIHI